MNNLYHWHDERMTELKMREIEREIQELRLLREAGLSGESWLARVVGALFRFVAGRGNSLRDHGSIEHQPYQSQRDRAAS